MSALRRCIEFFKGSSGELFDLRFALVPGSDKLRTCSVNDILHSPGIVDARDTPLGHSIQRHSLDWQQRTLEQRRPKHNLKIFRKNVNKSQLDNDVFEEFRPFSVNHPLIGSPIVYICIPIPQAECGSKKFGVPQVITEKLKNLPDLIQIPLSSREIDYSIDLPKEVDCDVIIVHTLHQGIYVSNDQLNDLKRLKLVGGF